MAGDVTHRHRQAAVLQRQHVVEVATHLGGRLVDVGEGDPVELRRQVGEDRARISRAVSSSTRWRSRSAMRRTCGGDVLPAVDELAAPGAGGGR